MNNDVIPLNEIGKIGTVKVYNQAYVDNQQKRIEELEKENSEPKAKNKWYSEQVCNKECAEVWGNLTKAKEIIKKFTEFVNNEIEYDSEHPQEHTVLWNELCEQAEQFLRETDIDNAIQKANEGLNLDKIVEEVENDLKEGCPDVLCEGCNKEDCIARKLGLIC